jgi:hypothetical protein
MADGDQFTTERPWINRASVVRVCRRVVVIHSLLLGVWVALAWNGSNELGPNWVMGFWTVDFPSSWLVLSAVPASWVADAVTSKVVLIPVFLVVGAVQWSILVLAIVQFDRFIRNPRAGRTAVKP